MLEVIWKPVIIFIIGFIILRILGKKAVSEMTSFDILIIIIIGTGITEPILTNKFWPNILQLLILAIVYYVFSMLSIHNRFKNILLSKPTILVQNGKLNKEGLKKVRLSIDNLNGILRTKGFVDIKDLELVMMERNGSISAIPIATKRPLQPNDIQLHPSPTFIPIPLIIDGQIIEPNLSYINKEKSWLYEQMKTNNLFPEDISYITLATYNQQGFVDFDTIETT